MARTAHAAAPAIPETPSPEERLLSLRELGHSLRTPLCAIIGFAEMLAQEHRGPIGDETYREYAEIIGRSGTEMLSLVNTTLLGLADEVRRPAD